MNVSYLIVHIYFYYSYLNYCNAQIGVTGEIAFHSNFTLYDYM